MKIAVVHNLPSGGARRALVESCRALRRRGHTIEAFSTDAADEHLLAVAPAVDRAHSWTVPRLRPGQAALFEPGIRPLWMGVRLLRALGSANREIARHIDEGGFDVVLATHDRYTHAPGVLRHLATPSAYLCEEPLRLAHEAQVGLQPPSRGGLPGAVARTLALASLRATLGALDRGPVAHATLLLANSVYSHEAILRAYGRPARVVYKGVDAHTFRPLGLVRDRVVLSVGAMHPTKGFDFLITALGLLPANERPALRIISDRGSSRYRALLEAHAARLGVTVHFQERVGETELVRAYNGAALVVYAPYLEPFGLVPLEAMACGTPVVAVAEGGVRETVRDGATGLLTARDPHAFARAIARVLGDDALARHLTTAARAEVARHWSWEATAERLEEALLACRSPAGFQPASSTDLTPVVAEGACREQA